MIDSKVDITFAKHPLHAFTGHSRQLYLLLAKCSGLFVLFDWAVNLDSEQSGLKIVACLALALVNGKYLIDLYRCLFLPCHCQELASISRAELRSVCRSATFVGLAVLAGLYFLRDNIVMSAISPSHLVGAVILLTSLCFVLVLQPAQSRSQPLF